MRERQTQQNRDDAPAPPAWEAPPDPAPVLVEVSGDVGLLLWQALHDVLAWVGAPEGQRVRVFSPGALATRRARLARVALPSPVAVPLGLVADLTGNPMGMPPLLVTRACLHLAQHLRDCGAGLSALAFARAAALASPGHARTLLEVARLLGPTRQEEVRACLLHAQEHAAARGEPRLCAEIHAELAALAFRGEDTQGARGYLLAALRAGRRRAS